MNWTTATELKQQTQKLWDKGIILAALVQDEPLFPKRLVLKSPNASQLADNFEAVRNWSQSLSTMQNIRLELRESKHRIFGSNQLPVEAWLDDVDSAINLIGKQKAAKLFKTLITETEQQHPALKSWLGKKPLRALELAEDWSRLLAVITWITAHPQPNIYLRQIDIAGVHSKFVEANRSVLAELLDIVLPSNQITQPVSQFNPRYGFLDKPTRIRFRLLDPACSPIAGLNHADITLDADSFCQLPPLASQIFITENEINFLAFPAVKNSIVIFGAGYGFSALSQAHWLKQARIHYWGDIDTHGFAILNELRSHFLHVASFLMDKETLIQFKALWGVEDKPSIRDLSYLTREEESLYNDLRDNKIQANLRLEQERIGFDWVLNRVERLDDPLK